MDVMRVLHRVLVLSTGLVAVAGPLVATRGPRPVRNQHDCPCPRQSLEVVREAVGVALAGALMSSDRIDSSQFDTLVAAPLVGAPDFSWVVGEARIHCVEMRADTALVTVVWEIAGRVRPGGPAHRFDSLPRTSVDTLRVIPVRGRWMIQNAEDFMVMVGPGAALKYFELTPEDRRILDSLVTRNATPVPKEPGCESSGPALSAGTFAPTIRKSTPTRPVHRAERVG